MSRSVRAFAAVVLAVVFLASPVVAATPSSGSGSSWGSVWDWIVELLLPEEELPSQGQGNGDAGGGIDPDGSKVLGVPSEPRREIRSAVR